jgi:phage virion morphogenesis protein
MTGARIALTVEDSGLHALFARLTAAGADLGPVMAEIAGDVEETTRRRFDTGSGPGGVAWPPSARAKKTGGKTLVDSGQLEESITSRSSAMEAEVGTNKEYAALHQFGGAIDRPARTVVTYRKVTGAMNRFKDWRFVKKSRANFAEEHAVAGHKAVYPARPFLGIDGADEARIARLIERHLARAIAGAGAGGVA